VNTVMNLRFPQESRIFLASWVTISFSHNILHHGVNCFYCRTASLPCYSRIPVVVLSACLSWLIRYGITSVLSSKAILSSVLVGQITSSR
jgi:hypothetical protein